MMTEAEVRQLLVDTKAVLEGHFLLTSGLHSPLYVEKFNVLQHPEYTEKLCKEFFAHDYRKDEIVELVVLVDICKEAGYDHAESVSGNGPCGVLTAGTGTEVLAGNENFTAVGRVVEYEIFLDVSILVVAPISEKIVTEEFLVSRCGFQKTRRNNLVGVDIFQRKGHTCACYYIEFLFHRINYKNWNE